MNLAIPNGTQVPTEPGTQFEGGFYVGRFRLGDKTCLLIVAPKAKGETEGTWQRITNDVPDCRSFFDGMTNTAALSMVGSPIARWAMQLDINGFDDWYLPSRDELELLYRHLKPTAESNYVWRHGDNPSSVPAGYPYTDELPLQTSVTAFQDDGPEAFSASWYWSSTQYSRSYAWGQYFGGGSQYGNAKSYTGRARAVRRLVID